MLLAIGQDNAFPWIEKNIGIDFNEWDCPIVDKTTMQSSHPKVFLVVMLPGVLKTSYGL